MKTVNIKVATFKAELPEGKTSGLLRISILELDLSQDVEGVEASFPDIPPGAYIAQAVRLDANGDNLSAPIQNSFMVPVPKDYDAPAIIEIVLV